MKLSHAVIDNVFSASLCQAAAKEWPASDWDGWNVHYSSMHQRKRCCNQWEHMPEACRLLLSDMMLFDVGPFQVDRMFPDASLWGAGMCDMGRGDYLRLHLDADAHAQFGAQRLLNTILFLTPDWRSEWNGDLEIWDAQRAQCVTTITPVFNRLILFAPSDDLWHGVPRALVCPEGIRRKTLTLWWYGENHDGISKRQRAEFDAKNHPPMPEGTKQATVPQYTDRPSV